MVIQLNIIGVLLMALALVHAIFPKYFHWEEEFRSVSLMNRQMMYIHTLFLGVVLLLMGLLCLTSARDLTETVLGRRIAFGFGLFWGLRLFVQFFGYRAELWKGKFFESGVHVVFSLFWAYLTGVFMWVCFG